MTETDSLGHLRSLVYELTKHTNYKNVTDQMADPFSEAPLLNADKTHAILRVIKELQGAVAGMLADHARIHDIDFFTYFTNRFQEYSGQLIEALDPSGELKISEEDLRKLLRKIQMTYLKALAVYEIYQRNEYPSITVFEEKIIPFLEDVLDEVLQAIETNKLNQFQQHDQDWLRNTVSFQSELVRVMPIFFLKSIRTIFMYYTLFRNSELHATIKRSITQTIARLLLRMMIIQEQIDGSKNKIDMKPGTLLKHLYRISNELERFLHFTHEYMTRFEFNTHLSFSNPAILKILQDESTSTPQNREIEVFTKLACPGCQMFFQSALWTFLQQVARRLSLRIRVIDLENSEDALALSVGIYGIRRTPTLKFKDRVYKINPAKETGKNPHSRTMREILDFFNILGQYDFESSLDGPKNKQDSRKKSRQDDENGD